MTQSSEIITCPDSNCAQKLRVPTDKGNLNVTCPHCGGKFDYSPTTSCKNSETIPDVKSRCKLCNGDLNRQSTSVKLPEEYNDLCDTCIMTKYKTEHSFQQTQLRDGRTGLTVKHILVDRANVENLDISDAEVIANDVTEELRSTGDYQPWNISISGYDDDPRALFEIPEIREWCKKCLDQIPYLLALLSQNTIDWFSLCVVDVNASGSGEDKLKVDMRITEEDANMLITSTMHAWKFFADCGINNEDAGKLAEQAQRRLPWFKNMPSH